ncbi:hypothetical protein [Demequina gelatinilytica]|uniref:hypothetical protein n=1 Tax=Demequina gelatinilytica TaxID=1638980 RepID=UPI000783DC1C|nr:hypothetical protein [Demequina gelatinilytica]
MSETGSHEFTTRDGVRAIMMTERTRFGDETAAGVMANRCAFTSRDMGADWPEAFTYAIVMGWGNDDDECESGECEVAFEDCKDPAHRGMAEREVAAKFGWDETLIAFLRDAHDRFKALPQTANRSDGRE